MQCAGQESPGGTENPSDTGLPSPTSLPVLEEPLSPTLHLPSDAIGRSPPRRVAPLHAGLQMRRSQISAQQIRVAITSLYCRAIFCTENIKLAVLVTCRYFV